MFKFLRKIIKDANTQSTHVEKTSVDTGEGRTANSNFSSEFNELMQLYKKNKPDWEVDVKKMIHTMFPEARPNTCPYCKAEFAFTAKRARKCPECKDKMIVRQGYFLKEEQVEKYEEESQRYFEKQGAASDLENNLRYAQDSKVNNDAIRMYRALADSFRAAAKLENKKDSKGFDYWDKAWKYYNQARTTEMKTLSRDMIAWSDLPRTLFDMAETLYEQSRYDSARKEKLLKNSLTYSFLSLAESLRFGQEQPPYNLPQIYERVKSIIEALEITDDELYKIAQHAVEKQKLNNSQMRTYNKYITEAKNYELFNNGS